MSAQPRIIGGPQLGQEISLQQEEVVIGRNPNCDLILFSLAVNRFDNRREAVIQEANAISTAWLNAGLIEGPEGEALRSAIRSYVDIRLQLANADNPRQVDNASVRVPSRP